MGIGRRSDIVQKLSILIISHRVFADVIRVGNASIGPAGPRVGRVSRIADFNKLDSIRHRVDRRRKAEEGDEEDNYDLARKPAVPGFGVLFGRIRISHNRCGLSVQERKECGCRTKPAPTFERRK
jgi:hypothetical protein